MNDYANILSSTTEQKLNSVLRQQWESGGSQLTILTIPSLEGMPIEEYSIKVVESWQLGNKSKDNGVLFLLAMKDRKMRIEVGQGLEGILPDAYARRILDNEVTPYMKRGDYDQAVISGVVGILERTDPKIADTSVGDGALAKPARSGRSGNKIIFLVIFFWVVMSILRTLFGFGRRRRGGFGSGAVLGALLGSSVGRGGGWGDGGGGGWSGGGGGFSGGGSSGSW